MRLERSARGPWLTGARPDRSGMGHYVEIIRATNDPERRALARSLGGDGTKPNAPHLSMAKTKPEDWRRSILDLLEDGVPRTLNRLGVEICDQNADVTSWSPFAEALWMLVEEKLVQYTQRAPVYFMVNR